MQTGLKPNFSDTNQTRILWVVSLMNEAPTHTPNLLPPNKGNQVDIVMVDDA